MASGGNWIKNFGKSVKFSAIDMVQDKAPAMTDLYNTNSDFIKEMGQTVKDIRRGQGQLSRLLQSTNAGKMVNDIAKNTKESLKSGKLYDEDRENKAMGLDMGDDDFNFGSDDFDFGDVKGSSDGPSVSMKPSPVGASDIAVSRVEKATVAVGTQTVEGLQMVGGNIKAQSGIIAKGFEKSDKLNASIAINAMLAQQSLHKETSAKLQMINDNLANMISFNNDTMSKFAMGSMKYYDDSLEVLNKISSNLESMAPKKQMNNQSQSQYDKVMGVGGFDAREYAGAVAQNLKSMPIIGDLAMVLDSPEMLAKVVANPLSFVLSKSMEQVIPKVINTAFSDLDKSVGNFFPALMGKLSKIGSDPTRNPLVQFLAKTFGIDAPSIRADRGRYEKGAVPFDGITRKTINQVIPTQLSKIVSLLSGQEERMFNHATGRFQTVSAMKKDVDREDKSRGMMEVTDVKMALKDALRGVQFNTKNGREKANTDIENFLMKIVSSSDSFNVKDRKAYEKMGLNDPAMANFVYSIINSLPKNQQIGLAGANYRYRQGVYERNQRAGIEGDFRRDYLDDGWGIYPRHGKGQRRGLRRMTAEEARRKRSSRAQRSSQSQAYSDAEIEAGVRSGKVRLSDFADAGAANSYAEAKAGERKVKTEPGGFAAKAQSYFKSPIKLLTDTIEKVDSTLYRIIFSDNDKDKSLLGEAVAGIKKTFTNMKEWLDKEVYSPVKRFLFGEDFTKSNFYKMYKKVFDNATSMLVGDKKGGKFTGGFTSSIVNEFYDIGKAIKYTFNGKAYTDSNGKKFGDTDNNILGEMNRGFKSGFSTLKAYLFGHDDKKKSENKPLIDTIYEGMSHAYMNFSNFFFGTKMDTSQAIGSFTKGMREKLPKGLARGAVIGTGLSLASLAGPMGGFGVLGSIFLPGGPIGSMILGTSIGMLSQSDKVKDFLFGKIGEKGDRQGGLVSKGVQNFFNKNKTAILGGGIFGGIKGILGVSIPGIIGGMLGLGGAAGAVGAIPAMGVGLVGPVLMGSAMGIALKSKRMQTALFGDKDSTDPKKATGMLNGAFMKSVKSKVPNMVFGALGFKAGAMALGSMGYFGALATAGPIPAALLGAGVGLAVGSEKFKEALFGKFDKDGNYKSGLVDKLHNVLTTEITNPLKIFVSKGALSVEKWFVKSVTNPISDAMTPLKLMLSSAVKTVRDELVNTFKGVNKGITAVFKPFLSPLASVLKQFLRGMRSLTGSLIKNSAWLAGQAITMPIKVLSATAMAATGYYKMKGVKENISNKKYEMYGTLMNGQAGFKDKAKSVGRFAKAWLNPTSEGYGPADEINEAQRKSKERNKKQDKYFSARERRVNSMVEKLKQQNVDIEKAGWGATSEQIARKKKLKDSIAEDNLAGQRTNDQLTAINKKQLDENTEQTDELKKIESNTAKMVNALSPNTSPTGGVNSLLPAENGDLNASEALGESAGDIADKGNSSKALVKAEDISTSKASGRDADKNVAALVGRQTGQAIVAQRKEEGYRKNMLDAVRGIGKNTLKEKKDDMWDKLKKFLSNIETILGIAGILGVLKAIFGFMGNHAPDVHDKRIVKDMAQKATHKVVNTLDKGIRKVTGNKHGIDDAVEKGWRRGVQGLHNLRDRLRPKTGPGGEPNEGNVRYETNPDVEARMRANGPEPSAAEIEASASERGGIKALGAGEGSRATEDVFESGESAASKARRVQFDHNMPNESEIIDVTPDADGGYSYKPENEPHPAGEKLDADLGDAKEKEEEGLLKKFKDLYNQALGKIKANKFISEKLGPGMGTLLDKLMEISNKITKSNFGRIAGKVSKMIAVGVAKLTGDTVTGGAIQAIFSTYDAISGAVDAAEMFRVNPEDVTAGMRLSCSILQVILGLPCVFIIDIGIECVYELSGGAIDIKGCLLKMIYESLPGDDKVNIDDLRQKSESEYQAYLEENPDATYADYQKNKSDNYHPVLDKVRETSVGRFLTGGNDENGNYQKGLFAKGKDLLVGHNDENGNYQRGYLDYMNPVNGVKDLYHGLVGDNDKEGNYQPGLFSMAQSGINNNLAWLAGQNDENGNFQKGALQKAGEFFTGSNDENGNYQKGAFAKMGDRLSLDNNLAWMFGQNDADTGEFRKGAIQKMTDRFDNELDWLFGKKDVNTGEEVQEGAIKKGIDNNLAWIFGQNDDEGNYQGGVFSKLYNGITDRIGNELAWLFGQNDDEGNFKKGAIRSAIDNNLAWIFGQNDENGNYQGGIFSNAYNGIKDGIDTYVIAPLTEAWQSVSDAASDIKDSFGSFIQNSQQMISDNGPIRGVFGITANMLRGMLGLEWSADPIQQAINGLIEGVRSAFNGISETFSDLMTAFKNFDAIEFVKTYFNKFMDAILPDSVKNRLNTAAESISDMSNDDDKAKGLVVSYTGGKFHDAGAWISNKLFGGSGNTNPLKSIFGTRGGAGEGDVEYDSLGNVAGADIPDYNMINEGDDLSVIAAKKAAQQKMNIQTQPTATDVAATDDTSSTAPSTSEAPDTSKTGTNYFLQTDGQWKDKPVLSTNSLYGDMSEFGCGPTALASAISTVTGDKDITPDETAGLINSSVLARGNSKGVLPSYFPKAASELGAKVYALPTDNPDALSAAVRSGMTMIAGGESDGSGPFTKYGHYTMLRGGYSKDGKDYAYSYDPLSKGRNKAYDISSIIKGTSSRKGPGFIGVVSNEDDNSAAMLPGAMEVTGDDIKKYIGGSGINGDDILATGEKRLGVPYVLGGDGDSSTDCGKFTLDTFAECGFDLTNRCADEQYRFFESKGGIIDSADAQPGDLLFFSSNDNGYAGVGHVGIYAGNNQVLNAACSTGVAYADMSKYWGDHLIAAGSVQKVFGIAPGTGKAGNGKPGSGKGGKDKKKNKKSVNPFEAFFGRFNKMSQNYAMSLIGGKAYTGTAEDDDNDSGGSHGSAVSTGENEKDAWSYLKKDGFTDAGAAGVMGNIRQESGFNPEAVQDHPEMNSIDPPDYCLSAGEGEHAYGIAQWTGSRLKKLKDYADSKGTHAGEMGTQLEYMIQEASDNYSSAYNNTKSADDPVAACQEWASGYEGCGVNGSRDGYASEFYDKYSGQGGGGNVNPLLARILNSNQGAGGARKGTLLYDMQNGGGGNTAPNAGLNGLSAPTKAAEVAQAMKLEFDDLGNVKGLTNVPDYNIITADDDMMTRYSKQRAQIQYYQQYKAANDNDAPSPMDKAVNAQITNTSDESFVDANDNGQEATLSRKWGLHFDGLGNVKGVDIPDQYKISASDNDDIKYQKQRVQIEHYNEWKYGSTTNANNITVNPNPTGATAADLAKKYSAQFDELCNVKGIQIPDDAFIKAGDDDTTKFRKQRIQLEHYQEWKAAFDAQNANKPQAMTQNVTVSQLQKQVAGTSNGATNGAISGTNNTGLTTNGASATDNATSGSGNATTNDMISAIRSLDIKTEVNEMIQYLKIIAGQSIDTSKQNTQTQQAANKATGGIDPSKVSSPSAPANLGSTTATNKGGGNSYASIHALNLQIAKGGEFSRS